MPDRSSPAIAPVFANRMKRTGAGIARKKKHAAASAASGRAPQSGLAGSLDTRCRKGRTVTVRQDGNRFLTLKELEREHIGRVLAHVNHNRTRAAEILGIDRVSLWRKIKRHEVGCHLEE